MRFRNIAGHAVLDGTLGGRGGGSFGRSGSCFSGSSSFCRFHRVFVLKILCGVDSLRVLHKIQLKIKRPINKRATNPPTTDFVAVLEVGLNCAGIAVVFAVSEGEGRVEMEVDGVEGGVEVEDGGLDIVDDFEVLGVEVLVEEICAWVDEKTVVENEEDSEDEVLVMALLWMECP